jgi:adenine/guanine phosphoribosyltransferase-like PRPP-binding protein
MSQTPETAPPPPHAFWQEIVPAGVDAPAVTTPHRHGWPAVFPDGRRLLLPIRELPGRPGEAVASLIVNQASFAVHDALCEGMATLLASERIEVVVGLPTLGLSLAADVARRLGHPRYVALGTSAKFWYDPALSRPLRSITSPDQSKTLYLDPRLLPVVRGRRIALIDDVLSTGRSITAGLALLRLAGCEPVAIAAAMLQTSRWRTALSDEDAVRRWLASGGAGLNGVRASAAEEVTFAERHAIVAQDGVGRGHVELEVGVHPAQKIVGALEAHFLSGHLDRDRALLSAVDLIGPDGCQKFQHLADAGLQVLEGGLGVGVRRHLALGQSAGAALGHVAGDLHLTRQREHVGKQAGLQQRERIDTVGCGMAFGLVENLAERGQAMNENGDGSGKKRQSHARILRDKPFPAVRGHNGIAQPRSSRRGLAPFRALRRDRALTEPRATRQR